MFSSVHERSTAISRDQYTPSNDYNGSSDGQQAGERRANTDRRSSTDRRIKDVGRPEGERRRGFDRRSGLERRGVSAYQKSAQHQREELIEKNLALVSYVVSRMAVGLPTWVDKRDLTNAGVIGLIDAANHFDPAKGVKFETYASTRIRGAIIDELRALDWIPRSTRAKSREIEATISKLVAKLNRFPTDEEVAGELGWEMGKYYKALDQVSSTTLLSLDEMLQGSTGGEPVARIDLVSGGEDDTLKKMERQELLSNIVSIIKGLSEQERLAIALYYYEELTLKEIGLVMSISESRVSQIHTAAILKLRARLQSLYSGS